MLLARAIKRLAVLRRDTDCLDAPLRLGDLKRDALALTNKAEAIGLDGRLVDKDCDGEEQVRGT